MFQKDLTSLEYDKWSCVAHFQFTGLGAVLNYWEQMVYRF